MKFVEEDAMIILYELVSCGFFAKIFENEKNL
jgi:hypothetical protein